MKPSVLFFSLFALVLACGEPTIQVGQSRGTGPRGGGAPGADGEPDAGVDSGRRPLREEDFVESESNRDPFRNYATEFLGPDEDGDDGDDEDGGRDVVMPDTSINEMQLIGIVSRLPNPRAMVMDRSGRGEVVRRGQYLGRAEVVQAGGPQRLPIHLNWRVERIRLPPPNCRERCVSEVILAREDPSAPDRPPLRRSLLLREDESGG